jgi:hypothetical protein
MEEDEFGSHVRDRCLLIAPALMLGITSCKTPTAGPTKESAPAAEQEIAQALLENDADAVTAEVERRRLEVRLNPRDED